PGPSAVDQLLGERALRAHGGERVRREEGVASQVLRVGGAVEEQQETEVRELRARVERVGRGNELLDERRRAHAPSFALRWALPRGRAKRCVSCTCSGPRSSGGVR